MKYLLVFKRIACVLLLAVSSNAFAADVEYTVDPAQSYLQLKETIKLSIGFPLTMVAQAPGSLSASYSGKITADISGGNIAVNSAELIAAAGGSYMPGRSPGAPA